jgi:amino acid transporter
MVFAFGMAAFIGFESGAIYSEEVRNPRVTVARATFVAVGFTGLFYAVSAWAMIVTVGPTDLQKQTRENGPGVVFAGLAEHWGDGVATLANMLFLTSVFAALLSFHNGVARYLFALGRERVLTAALSRVGTRSGGPVAGSLAQSALALVVVTVFAMFGADPVLQLFTWLSGTAAVGIVLLMAGTSAAVVGFFRTHRRGGSATSTRCSAPTRRHRCAGSCLASCCLQALWARSGRCACGRRGPTPTLRSARQVARSTTTTSRSCSTCPGRSTSCGGSCSQTPGPGRGGQVSGVSRPRA